MLAADLHVSAVLIEHFACILPTFLLLEADWAHTKQARPFMPMCNDIVSVGRLCWFEETKMSGKENYSWYRFDARHAAGPIFHARDAVPMPSRLSICSQCSNAYRPQRSDSKFCSDTCRQRVSGTTSRNACVTHQGRQYSARRGNGNRRR